ncbi:aminotransferase class V-fold PLP-dependent enzyme, partial [Motilimonas pumila]
DATALIFKDKQLSYGELNSKANQLAHYLINERRVKPDTLVGICIERSPDMVVAMLGVLKSGAAYVPLDPSYPSVRLAFMLEDATLETVVTHSDLLESLPIATTQAICLDDNITTQKLQQQPIDNLSREQLTLTLQHLAYVIYTSGSTGKPKGVEAPHASIINRVTWMAQQYPAQDDEVFCQKTAVGFVDHVAEIFQALAYGNPLVIIPTQVSLDTARFAQLVIEHKITRLTLVPSLLKLLIEQNALFEMTTLRLVISSGEALQLKEARDFYRSLPEAKLLNLYGSSEVGGDVSAYLVNAFSGNPEVMQYFLESPHDNGLPEKPSFVPNFNYQQPPSIDANKLFRDRYSRSELPQMPVEYQDYVGQLCETILPHVIDVTSQRYIGHMTSKLPSFIPELNRLIARLNQNMVKVETSNSLTLIERQVLAMMHRLFFQLPNSFYDDNCQDPNYVFGAVTGGGSVANMTALSYARNRGILALGYSQEDLVKRGAHVLLAEKGYQRAVVLGTQLMHYSMRKSVSMMGFGEDGIMYVAQDEQQKMSMSALQRSIEYCRSNNIFIIAVVGISGATETGTVDPLAKIAAIAHENDIHFHADAAWGGAFQLSPSHRSRLAGIEQADSITFCPHKMLYISQGISLCLLKDPHGASSIATHANYQAQKGSFDLGQYTVEGSRPAHALLLHASLHVLGQNGYAWLIEQSMRKTQYYTRLVQNCDSFQLVGTPDLNIINYRYIPVSLRSASSYSVAEQQEISEVVTKIQQAQFASGGSFASKTTIQLPNYKGGPITVFRIVLSNPLTTYEDLREVLVDQLRIANALVEQPSNHEHNRLASLSDEAESNYAQWRVPIGKAMRNTQLIVLDSHLNPVPQGVFGELHVGGACVARGYHNLPALTAEKFIKNPFYDILKGSSSERLYKTGDLVRWLPEGELEFFGRIDNQVKIRGFRIELGEIEHALHCHEVVKSALVLMMQSESEEDILVAYVVPCDRNNEVEQEIKTTLRTHISQLVPDYMVPAVFILLDALPLLPNGKVDRKRLLGLDLSEQQGEYVAPASNTEDKLCAIWQKVLGVEIVGVKDNFFQLGGNSLLATKVLAQINLEYNTKLSLQSIFADATVSNVASMIDALSLNSSYLVNLSTDESLEEGLF